jgi:uncharacterized protein (DUF1697 family)
MKIYIALFRGINVGGKHLLPMKELVAQLEALDCRRVKTYIQSGNAVFESPDHDAARISKLISGGVKKQRGFEPYVLLLGFEEMEKAIANNPYSEAEIDPKAVHLGFLASAPMKPDLASLESLRSGSERYQLIDNVFYLLAPEGIGRSKLAANTERLLGVPMTDRNWRTVCKIMEMANQLTCQNLSPIPSNGLRHR